MGGIGSGARRSANIDDVESALRLDIRVLRRLGVIRAGECVCEVVHWSKAGLHAPSVHLRADLSGIECGGLMTITGLMPEGSIIQHITIEAVPTAFGGTRHYYMCPVSARRCEIIYYVGGCFASREAQRLTYATQNVSSLSCARRKAAKLRRRLAGAEVGRPRGRNRNEIIERLRVAEREERAIYFDRLSAMAERSGTRRMPARSK